jgi:membrane protease YdiL (CAAX protease family)
LRAAERGRDPGKTEQKRDRALAGKPLSDSDASTLATPGPSRLAWLDTFMGQHPWHPRIVPFLVYVLAIPLVAWLLEHQPSFYGGAIALRAAVVVWLLWRYRRLLPEVTLRFDWLSVPVGVGVAVAWILLGKWMAATWPASFDADKPVNFFTVMGPVLGSIAFGVRLVSMATVVPIFEELFIRSLMLRSLHSFRRTGIGVLQFFQDLPVIGEWLSETRLGERVGRHPPVFGLEFEKTPLGALSLFGVAASTLIFMASHIQRDWPGTVVCGVAYCLLLAATRRKGLGPVIWAHGITNALLWGYTLYTNDWRFL